MKQKFDLVTWRLISSIFGILCVIAAGIICALGQYGWGWFLLVGILSTIEIEMPRKAKNL
jgi:hypothetical protein